MLMHADGRRPDCRLIIVCRGAQRKMEEAKESGEKEREIRNTKRLGEKHGLRARRKREEEVTREGCRARERAGSDSNSA
eukprot:scaffold1519_cov99-Isochrysis_galbana.AAC.7